MSLFTPDVIVDNQVVLDPTSSVQISNFPATQPVSGSVNIGNFPATQPVSGTVSISGTVPVTTGNATASTITQTTVNTSNVNVLAANANRKKIVIFASKATLYVKLGATASATSFTYALTAASSTLEISGWGGQVDVISTVNSNVVTVSELV